jgi:hypothetical protein
MNTLCKPLSSLLPNSSLFVRPLTEQSGFTVLLVTACLKRTPADTVAFNVPRNSELEDLRGFYSHLHRSIIMKLTTKNSSSERVEEGNQTQREATLAALPKGGSRYFDRVKKSLLYVLHRNQV